MRRSLAVVMAMLMALPAMAYWSRFRHDAPSTLAQDIDIAPTPRRGPLPGEAAKDAILSSLTGTTRRPGTHVLEATAIVDGQRLKATTQYRLVAQP